MTEKEEDHLDLTDDGVSEELLSLLWQKDELNFSPNINIPDSVIYKYGQPTHWYFTASSGRVKKKNRQNLISARIEEAFTKQVLGYDVLAIFITIQLEKNDDVGMQQPSTIEYLDRENLIKFLYEGKKNCNGILQKFVEPKGIKNEVIRAIWSPKVCLLERAENIHNLHDHRYGLYERCVTFEGPEYYSVSAPLRGPVMAGQIQRLCESIVSHVAEVTFSQKKICRVVLNFKIDSREKIWLLYSTSIRCDDVLDRSIVQPTKVEKKLVNINSVLNLPSVVNLNPQKSYDKIVPQKRIRCISCAKESLESMRHPVPYKSVIKHYEHVLHLIKEINGSSIDVIADWPPDPAVIEAAGGVGFGCIEMVSEFDSLAKKSSRLSLAGPLHASELHVPPILRYLHPKLSSNSFRTCKHDPLFLYKTVLVCEPCYLVYAEFTTMLLRLGQDLTKLLKPDPSAAALQTQTMNERSTLSRPSSADWRAMSSLNRSRSSNDVLDRSQRVSTNHAKAKKSAIGIRSNDNRSQPSFPSTIRNAAELQASDMVYGADMHAGAPSIVDSSLDFHHNLHMSNGNELIGLNQTSLSLNRSMSMGGLGANNASSGNVAPDDIRSMIAERERRFFKEVARNPQLRDQHPLMHLISAQQKLSLVDQQSGVLTTKEARKKQGLFGSDYGHQGGDEFDKFDAYKQEVNYVINGRVVSPSRMKSMKEAEKKKKAAERKKLLEQKKARQDLEASMGFGSASVSASGVAPGNDHQHFLLETMRQVQSEVAQSSRKDGPRGSFEGSVGSGASKGTSMSEGSARPSTTAQSRRGMGSPQKLGGSQRLVSGVFLEADEDSTSSALRR